MLVSAYFRGGEKGKAGESEGVEEVLWCEPISTLSLVLHMYLHEYAVVCVCV